MERCGQHVLIAGQAVGWCLAVSIERHEFDRLRLDSRVTADILTELGVIQGRPA